MRADRISVVKFHSKYQTLFAAGRKGFIYSFDLNLNLTRNSIFNNLAQSINAIDMNDEFLFARDSYGNILKYSIPDLKLIQIAHNESLIFNKSQNSTISPSHALVLYEDKIITLNGQGDIIILLQSNLQLIDQLKLPLQGFAETLCIEKVNSLFITTFAGELIEIPNLKEPLKYNYIKGDNGVIHHAKYHFKQDSYWFTTDNKLGFGLYDCSSQTRKYFKMTTDDVEWIEFNKDQTEAYLACFDHYLYVYETETKLTDPALKKRIGPFKFQLKQVIQIDSEDLIVLLESGELFKINPKDEKPDLIPFEIGNSFWSLDPLNETTFIAGLESGHILLTQFTDHIQGCSVEKQESFKISDYRIRRVLHIQDCLIVAIDSSGQVILYDFNTKTEIWKTQLNGILRDVSYNNKNNSVAVVSESGYLTVINVLNGEIQFQEQFNVPLWAVHFNHDNKVIFGERSQKLHLYDLEKKQIIKTLSGFNNIKRLRIQNNVLIVNCSASIWFIDILSFEKKQFFNEWLTTTCENSIIDENTIYSISYNNYLTAHNTKTTNITSVTTDLFDFPKGIQLFKTSQNKKYLLINGRGPYLSIFDINGDEPIRVSDHFFNP